MARAWASFYKHEQSQRMACMFLQDPVQMFRMSSKDRLSSRGMWEPPGRPILSLCYQCKGQPKSSFINLRQTYGKLTWLFVFPAKGRHVKDKRTCSRWQGHFCRPVESQLHWEHPESTESWSKVSWCGIVKDFFKKYRMDPGKETP